MCRLLVVDNNVHELEDRTRIYLALLKIPVELEIAPDFSSASQHLRSQESYDLMLSEFPLCDDGISLIKNARTMQPQMKNIFLTDSFSSPGNLDSPYCTIPSSMGITFFYNAMSQLAPETVKRASKRSDRWLCNHDFLMERILQVLRIIRKNYMEDISLDYLAEQVHSSPCYLSSLFTKYMGISPIAYVNEFRMEKAVEFLLNSDYTVTRICQLVGYRNLPYFCTCFKNKYNMTPAQFRKLNGVCVAS